MVERVTDARREKSKGQGQRISATHGSRSSKDKKKKKKKKKIRGLSLFTDRSPIKFQSHLTVTNALTFADSYLDLGHTSSQHTPTHNSPSIHNGKQQAQRIHPLATPAGPWHHENMALRKRHRRRTGWFNYADVYPLCHAQMPATLLHFTTTALPTYTITSTHTNTDIRMLVTLPTEFSHPTSCHSHLN
jgi:hypothetical protein